MSSIFSSTIERVSVIGATKRQHCTLQFSIDWKEYSEIMPASETACRFTSGSLAWIRDPVIETSTLTLWLGTGSSLISKTTAMQLSTLQFVRPTQNRVLFFQESFLLNLLPVNAKGHIAYCLWKCLYINSVHSLVKRQAVSEAGMISLYSSQSIENCSVQCCLFVAPITETLSIVDEASFNPVAQVFWFCSPPGEQCSISFFITFMVIWFTCCIIRIKSKGIMFW